MKSKTKEKVSEPSGSVIINDQDGGKETAGNTPPLLSKLAAENRTRAWARFTEMKSNRDQNFHWFNNKKLLDILDESQKRFGIFLRPRQDPEDWQTHYVGADTRNKIIAILARLASQRMKRSWYGEVNDDKWKARVCRVLDEAAAYLNQDDMQTFFEMLSAFVKGTVVGYEGYMAPVVKFYDITDYDAATGEIKYNLKKKKEWNDVFGQIIPLEDFYPGNLRVTQINGPVGRRMNDCCWETYMGWDEFETEFSKYPNFKYVKPGGEAKEMPMFKDFCPPGLKPNGVHVLRYFKRPTANPDCMYIQANGQPLTPDVSPLPWNHKKKNRGLPFWVGGGEPYDEEFFYRMPIPMKLKGDTDIKDSFMRMSIDQLWLGLNRPTLSNDPEDIEDKGLYPGVVWEVTDPDGTKQLETADPSPQVSNFIRILSNNINLSTVDNNTSGSAGASGPQTATEVEAAQQGALQIADLLLRFMEWSMTEKGNLRMSNMQQFYPIPLGTDEKTGKPRYRNVRVDGVPKILDGKTGSVKINFVPSKSDLPPTPILDPEQRARLVETYGEDFDQIVVKTDMANPNVEEVWMTAEYIKDFSAGCRPVPNSSVKDSDALKRAQEDSYMDRIMALFPNLVDPVKAFKQYNEVYDRDPEEIMVDQQEQQGPQLPPELQGLMDGLPTPGAGGGGGPVATPKVNTALLGKNRPSPIPSVQPTASQVVRGR